MQLTKFSILSLIGLAAASPTAVKRDSRGTSTSIKIVNNCPVTIQVGQLANGGQPGLPTAVPTGGSQSFSYDSTWSGRFWAREYCEGYACAVAGAASPASLAEFTFLAANDGHDYYDLSFVDGYNLPLSITPVNPIDPTLVNSHYWCGAPKCSPAPACDHQLQVKDSNGNYVGCLSACSKFNEPQYCCTGAYNTPETCPINSYAQVIKNACPDVYSYAYDDKASLFQCIANAYTITWCP